jgi:ADP-ribose diphosphatase
MPTKPRILSRTLVAQTRVFQVEQLELEFANGQRRCFERIDGGERGAVLVVPLLDAGTLGLIREYAAGTHRYELGFPKGRIEAGEEPTAAALREIREEIGCGDRKSVV